VLSCFDVNFSKNLFFTTAGSGYSLKFTGLSPAGQPFAATYSPSFNVSLGLIYKLVVTSFLGHAFAGTPFQNNPVVGVADKGGNVVKSLNSGHIFANITNSGIDLLPSSKLKVKVVNGLAVFKGLYINEAADWYQIHFSTNLPVTFSSNACVCFLTFR
jgi:hypothetical protein